CRSTAHSLSGMPMSDDALAPKAEPSPETTPKRRTSKAAGGDPTAPLTDGQLALLTQARTYRWKFEAYEFAYDARVRKLCSNKTVLEFLAVLVALLFLFLQYLVKEDHTAHTMLGYVGTGLSLAVILMVVW